MQRYIAFLSGLPVGRNGIEMSTLKAHFNRLGFLNVETYLTSGNVAFDTTPVGLVGTLEAQISRHLSRSIGTQITTFIRTQDEIAAIVANAPVTEKDGSPTFVILLADPLDARAERRVRVRELYPVGREVYWVRDPEDTETPPPALADVLDTPATVRSLNTLKHFASRRPAPRSTESELFRR
jgi:uncharacterized protein (DUF1697 family)